VARCALCAAGRRGRSILLDFDTALVFPLNKYGAGSAAATAQQRRYPAAAAALPLPAQKWPHASA
jgi:hypothetical protein